MQVWGRAVRGKHIAATVLAAAASVVWASPAPAPVFDPGLPTALSTKGVPSFQAACAKLHALGYLPIQEVRPTGPTHQGDPAGQAVVFDFPVPPELQRIADSQVWGPRNPFVRGAVIAFSRANGLQHRAGASQGLLTAPLEAAILSGQADTPAAHRWEWVLVNKHLRQRDAETLKVWKAPASTRTASNARTEASAPKVASAPAAHADLLASQGYVFKTPVSTGVLGQTPDVTSPVWERLPRTRMRGVFPRPVSWAFYKAQRAAKPTSEASAPTGTRSLQAQPAVRVGLVGGHPVQWVPYDDPGILWVSYFDGGRGIHYFPRRQYGFPQSAGCVEEPKQAAKAVYELLHYGVPVSVVSGLPVHGS